MQCCDEAEAVIDEISQNCMKLHQHHQYCVGTSYGHRDDKRQVT